jgi:G3E family GTPase
VVLVNEFGDVGLDGDLLTGRGGDVVEMPSGCICCTLQTDFRSQMLEISRTINPDRVVIEPTGVATIAQIRSIVEAQLFEDTIEEINNILIADATGFMNLYKANRHFVESQVEHAQLALLNKCDRVDKRKAMVIQGAILAINPEMTVLMTEFGAVDWAEYQFALSTAPGSGQNAWKEKEHITHITEARNEDHFSHDSGRDMHIHLQENEDALGYESFGCVYDDISFDRGALEEFFQQLTAAESQIGEIVRAKGVFRIGEKYILMELASSELSSQPISRSGSGQSKISIIGRGLDREMITAALERCVP